MDLRVEGGANRLPGLREARLSYLGTPSLSDYATLYL